MNEGCFILQNINKPFKDGHTHIYNYHIAKVIMHCCIHGVFPRKYNRLKNNRRIVESIIRVCGNNYKLIFEKMLLEIDKKIEAD